MKKVNWILKTTSLDYCPTRIIMVSLGYVQYYSHRIREFPLQCRYIAVHANAFA